MKLFLLTQTEIIGYDTYDSAVVAAESAEMAIMIHPASGEVFGVRPREAHGALPDWRVKWPEWATHPALVTATYLGEATEGTAQGVICSSFNAG